MLLLTLFSDFSWLLERKCKLPSTPFCWPLWPHLTPLLCALSRHQGFFCASHRTFLSFWNNLKAFHMAIFFLFQDLSSDVTFMESLSLYMLSQSSYIPQPLSQESVLISVLINFCINWLNCLIFFFSSHNVQGLTSFSLPLYHHHLPGMLSESAQCTLLKPVQKNLNENREKWRLG